MVKKSKKIYTIDDWKKDNTLEVDIMLLIAAAKAHASSLKPHADIPADDPNLVAEPWDDELTEFEWRIERASQAIKKMLDVAEARKEAGLKPRGRGPSKGYNPLDTEFSDPQVQVFLQWQRGEKNQEIAISEIADLISVGGNVDARTLSAYVAGLVHLYGWFTGTSGSSKP